MDLQQIAAIFAEINAKLDTFKTLKKRLNKVESTHDQTLLRNNHRNNTDDLSNLNAQYQKKTRSMSPSLITSRPTTFHRLDTPTR